MALVESSVHPNFWHKSFAPPKQKPDLVNGYWTRAEVVKMDTRALARLAATHPQMCPMELKEAITRALEKKRLQQLSTPPPEPKTAEEILIDLFGSLVVPVSEPQKTQLSYVEIAHAIRRKICEKYNISMSDLDSDFRARKLIDARFEAIYLIGRDTELPYSRIAKMFGDRDHSSILHAMRCYADRNGLPRVRG